MLKRAQVERLRRDRTPGRNRLKQAMELAGVTQVQLAAATGLTQSYISKIKTENYGDISGETMRALATYFGCAIDDLFPVGQAVAS